MATMEEQGKRLEVKPLYWQPLRLQEEASGSEAKWPPHLPCVRDRPFSREQDLGTYKALVTPPEPVFQFNSAEPTLAEAKEAVKPARSSAVFFLNDMSYKV